MDVRRTMFALTLLLGGGASAIGSLFATATPAEANGRTMVETAKVAGATDLSQLKSALSSGRTTVVIPSGDGPAGCATKTTCLPPKVEGSKGGTSAGSLIKGALAHMAASCFAGVVSNGEAQLTLVGQLTMNTLAAEGCFQFFEKYVKQRSLLNGMGSFGIFCSEEHGQPGLKAKNTAYYGVSSTVGVEAQVLRTDFQQMQDEAERLGFKIHDAGNVGQTGSDYRTIVIEIPVKTDAVFTKDEAKEIADDVTADLAEHGFSLIPINESNIYTRYDIRATTGAVYEDGRKIEGTRALAIKSPLDAARSIGDVIGRSIDRALAKAERKYGKVCVVFDPKSGQRYTARTSAVDKGKGTCLGTIPTGDGKVMQVMGRYIPDFAKRLVGARPAAPDVRPGGG